MSWDGRQLVMSVIQVIITHETWRKTVPTRSLIWAIRRHWQSFTSLFILERTGERFSWFILHLSIVILWWCLSISTFILLIWSYNSYRVIMSFSLWWTTSRCQSVRIILNTLSITYFKIHYSPTRLLLWVKKLEILSCSRINARKGSPHVY